MIPQLGLLLATAAAFAPTRINKYSLSTRLGATPLGENLPLVITTIDARPVEGEPGVYDFDSEGSVWPHRGRHTWGYTRTLGVHQKHLGVHPQEFKYCSRALVRF